MAIEIKSCRTINNRTPLVFVGYSGNSAARLFRDSQQSIRNSRAIHQVEEDEEEEEDIRDFIVDSVEEEEEEKETNRSRDRSSSSNKHKKSDTSADGPLLYWQVNALIDKQREEEEEEEDDDDDEGDMDDDRHRGPDARMDIVSSRARGSHLGMRKVRIIM